MTGTADISRDGVYRYTLTRPCLDNGNGTVVFVMLNPSTADANVDDPTIRRCVGFAQAWDYSRLLVVNLYALRATDPRELWKHPDPVGPRNDDVLGSAMFNYGDIVCAWGAHARASRVLHFRKLAEAVSADLTCLGVTKSGAPRHPLYLPKNSARVPWP